MSMTKVCYCPLHLGKTLKSMGQSSAHVRSVPSHHALAGGLMSNATNSVNAKNMNSMPVRILLHEQIVTPVA